MLANVQSVHETYAFGKAGKCPVDYCNRLWVGFACSDESRDGSSNINSNDNTDESESNKAGYSDELEKTSDISHNGRAMLPSYLHCVRVVRSIGLEVKGAFAEVRRQRSLFIHFLNCLRFGMRIIIWPFLVAKEQHCYTWCFRRSRAEVGSYIVINIFYDIQCAIR